VKRKTKAGKFGEKYPFIRSCIRRDLQSDKVNDAVFHYND